MRLSTAVVLAALVALAAHSASAVNLRPHAGGLEDETTVGVVVPEEDSLAQEKHHGTEEPWPMEEAAPEFDDDLSSTETDTAFGSMSASDGGIDLRDAVIKDGMLQLASGEKIPFHAVEILGDGLVRLTNDDDEVWQGALVVEHGELLAEVSDDKKASKDLEVEYADDRVEAYTGLENGADKYPGVTAFRLETMDDMNTMITITSKKGIYRRVTPHGLIVGNTVAEGDNGVKVSLSIPADDRHCEYAGFVVVEAGRPGLFEMDCVGGQNTVLEQDNGVDIGVDDDVVDGVVAAEDDGVDVDSRVDDQSEPAVLEEDDPEPMEEEFGIFSEDGAKVIE